MYITRYSTEPKNKFYVKDYGFLSFAKKIQVKVWAVIMDKIFFTAQ